MVQLGRIHSFSSGICGSRDRLVRTGTKILFRPVLSPTLYVPAWCFYQGPELRGAGSKQSYDSGQQSVKLHVSSRYVTICPGLQTHSSDCGTDNAIPIEGWINDPTDNDLLHLVPLLEGLQYVTDVRAFLALRGGEDGKHMIA